MSGGGGGGGGGGGRGAQAPRLPDFRREFQHHRSDRGRDLVQVVPAAQSKPVEQHRDDSDRLLEVDPGPWLAIEPAGHPVVGPDQDVDAGLVDVGVRREVFRMMIFASVSGTLVPWKYARME